MKSLPPDIVRFSLRSGDDNDCALAAIEMATGISYNVLLAEAIQVCPGAVKDGMIWRDMRAVITALGMKTTLKRKYDIDEDTGILGLEERRKGRHKSRREHVVYLWEGRVIEPWPTQRGAWLDPSAFLANEGWKATTLLVVHR